MGKQKINEDKRKHQTQTFHKASPLTQRERPFGDQRRQHKYQQPDNIKQRDMNR